MPDTNQTNESPDDRDLTDKEMDEDKRNKVLTKNPLVRLLSEKKKRR